MDIFQVHQQLLADYKTFTAGFTKIHDPDIRKHVDQRIANGDQWPDAYLSLNPNFASDGSITELVKHGLLHPRGGASYVLTMGTGSGKSLSYIVPIVDSVLRQRATDSYHPGVKAIIVYPMNALANSQRHELTKFLKHGYPDGGEPVTFRRYTGQDREPDRAEILNDPPDILLTNYVMLELVLTRPEERDRLELTVDPLVAWVESQLGVRLRADGRLVRPPRPVTIPEALVSPSSTSGLLIWFSTALLSNSATPEAHRDANTAVPLAPSE